MKGFAKNMVLTLIGLSLFLATFHFSFYCLYFQFDQAYIAKHYCIKRFDKNNCCQGACFIKEKLSQTHQLTATPSEGLGVKFKSFDWYHAFSSIDLEREETFSLNPSKKNFQTCFLTQSVYTDIFRPPQYISIL